MTYEKLVDGLPSEQVEKIEIIRSLYSMESRADIDVALSVLRDNKYVAFFWVVDRFHQLSHNVSPDKLYAEIVKMKNSCDKPGAEAVNEAERELRKAALGLEATLGGFKALSIESRFNNGKNYSNGARYAGKTINRQVHRKSLSP